jgi:hypothetical protein
MPIHFYDDKRVLNRAIESTVITVTHDVRRDLTVIDGEFQRVELLYDVMIDGFHVEATVAYTRDYRPDDFKDQQGRLPVGFNEWDTPSVTIGAFDAFRGSFGWRVHAKAIETILELNEYIIEQTPVQLG